MIEPVFIHLRAHSEFSISDGTIRIDDLVSRALEQGQPALGLTDLMNTFGLLKFYKACRAKGIKPIVGADVRVENLDNPDAPFRALLLVRDTAGYVRLCELLTAAFTDESCDRKNPHLKQAWLSEGDNSHLLCLSGAHLGEVGSLLMNERLEQARLAAEKWQSWFPNGFYLELQRLPEKPEWEKSVSGSILLAQELGLPVVATHPTQFLNEDDFKAHDARVCIAGGWTLSDNKRPRDFYPSQFFVSPDVLAERFADIPAALANSVEIAKRCNLTLTLGKNFLPVFPTPDGMDLNDYLRHLANEGLQERLAVLFPDEEEREKRLPEYQKRLDFELDIIIKMQFPGYFLIVQDFINWAKNNGCPVGPGRGSGAGSLVAYSLRITDLDPIKYALLFERFLNPERVSMPDFDVDFCQANRHRVIEYVREKYGKAAVSQIVTFGALSAKQVIRDVGRVLDLPFGLCDRLSKLIPMEKNKPMGLKEALDAEPEIKQILDEEDAWELMNLAKKLENLTRGTGVHAGGVLIAPSKISDFCPIYQADETSAPVSMYDKGDVEEIGLVKFDFLGLRNLTIINMAQDFIQQTTGEKINVGDLKVAKIDDQDAYQIFRDLNTTAVFQFESQGMKDTLSNVPTSNLEEIIAFVSLYRPGPMELIPDFKARMKGEEFEYMHPLLKPVLEPTYGVMVYQEQVMQAAQVVGGYSLGGADLLRRAMGKKKPEEMVKHREIFAKGAAEQHGITREKADEIFDYMEKFAGYGFNKSHAAAYAYVSFQTAWLKAHYPAEFIAATMSSELSNTDQLKIFYDDAQSKLNGITFLPPDINESEYLFIPNANKQIRYALGAIKGTGESAIENIVQARKTGGKFQSLFDFCERVDKQHVNRRTIESLICAGVFDSIEPNRAMLLGNVELAMTNAEQKAQHANQASLFDLCEDVVENIAMQPIKAWNASKQLAEEKEVIGFYLSGHPFAPFENEIRTIVPNNLTQIEQGDNLRLAGFVTAVRNVFTKKGQKLVFVQIEDTFGKCEITVAGELLEKLVEQKQDKLMLRTDQILVFTCRAYEDKFNPERGLRLNANEIHTLNQARVHYARALTLNINPKHNIPELARILAMHTEGERKIPLRFHYQNAQASGSLMPASKWRIALNEELLQQLEELLDEQNIKVSW
ncbi:MAG: DNA polymerase III subunit alpha [Neisseriaceae bacterium]|nr:DNA polymerase III subunit alpha [Neisseriaceae bacterium]